MMAGLRHRWQTTHVRFSLGFTLLLYTACNAINIDKLAKWFPGQGGVDYLALSAYLLAGWCLFLAIFVLLAHRWTTKPLAIVLTAASALVTYFIAKYNVAIDSTMMMNTFHTDATEVGQLASLQMIPYGLFLVALPVALILLIDIRFERPVRHLAGSLMIFVVALCVALGSVYLNYKAIHRAGNVSRKYIVYSLVPINVLSSTVNAAGKSLAPYLKSSRQEPEVAASVGKPGNLVVVLAIGEASRSKNFSLYGYQRRETNPVLKQFDGLHLLNGIATRGSTLYALPQILDRRGSKLPTLVARAGIPTACYVNFTLYDNCATVGETQVSECSHGAKCYDEDVIPLLAENLRKYQSGYNFVVLHLGGGSHGPSYVDRHPPEFQQFKPMCADADVANRCTLEQLYNSYDNTILYVDYVLGGILRTLEASGAPYVFIYLSDHGESLLEDGLMFHGMPPGMPLPPEQAQIPLIVKASVPIAIDARPEYQQPDVYDTVLDLLSVEAQGFDTSGSFIKTK